jgi:hypothetical protein
VNIGYRHAVEAIENYQIQMSGAAKAAAGAASATAGSA